MKTLLKTARAIQNALRRTQGLLSIQCLSEKIFASHTALPPEKYYHMCRYALEKSSPSQMIHGAKPFLNWARKHYTLILATNPLFPKELLQQRLDKIGVPSEWFAQITSSETFHYIKPQREYFDEILVKYKLQSENCLMIGNDHMKDTPAIHCGIPLAMIQKNGRHQHVSYFDDFDQLKKWMRNR